MSHVKVRCWGSRDEDPRLVDLGARIPNKPRSERRRQVVRNRPATSDCECPFDEGNGVSPVVLLIAGSSKVSKVKENRKREEKSVAWRKDGRVDYQMYLKSEEWKKKRLRALKSAGFKCNVCRSTQFLQVHHKSYKRLGREPLRDLQVLCRDCHANVHEDSKTGAMDRFTREFVSMFR